MSYLDRLPRSAGLVKHLVHGAVETAEYAGASYGFGYLQNRYREKASLLGVPADLLAGVVCKAAALSSNLFGVGEFAARHLDVVGNAGIGAYFHTMGSGHGAQASGVTRLLISKSDVPKAKAAIPGATILGDIGPAPKGDFLSAAELAELVK